MMRAILLVFLGLTVTGVANGQPRTRNQAATAIREAKKELDGAIKSGAALLKTCKKAIEMDTADKRYDRRDGDDLNVAKLLEESRAKREEWLTSQRKVLAEKMKELEGVLKAKTATDSVGQLQAATQKIKAKEKEVQSVVDGIEKLATNQPMWINEMPSRLPLLGDCGTLGELEVRIRQGDKEAIINRTWLTTQIIRNSRGEIERQVPQTNDTWFWMIGDFSKLADNSRFQPQQPYIVTGTKEFKEATAGQPKTLFVLEPLEINR